MREREVRVCFKFIVSLKHPNILRAIRQLAESREVVVAVLHKVEQYYNLVLHKVEQYRIITASSLNILRASGTSREVIVAIL